MLADDLRTLDAGEVYTDTPTLEHYSTDASLFRMAPAVVVAPRSVDDLKKLVQCVVKKQASGENVSLTARAAGTCMSGGSLTESVMVDFTKHFNTIGEVEGEAEGTPAIAAEPGVYFRDLEKVLNEHGLMFPSYPASKELCAVGGIVSNNSGGEKTLAYGKTAKYVRELHVVLSDGNEYVIKPLTAAELEQKEALPTFEGELYRHLHQLIDLHYDIIESARPKVSKNSAGYALWDVWDHKTFDLTKLITGSQGTLGFVTKAKLGLVKPKPYRRLFIVYLKDIHHLASLTEEILTFKPESLESFDDHTFKLAVRYFPSLLGHMHANMFTLGLRFIPDLLRMLFRGVPKLTVLIELTGEQTTELDERVGKLADMLHREQVPHHIARTEGAMEKYWAIRRESFNLLRHRIKNRQTAPFIDDIVVRPETMSEFLPRLSRILDDYKDLMDYTIAGHIGDGNFHIIPLMNLHDPESRAAIRKLANEVYTLVFEFGGSMTGEHNDGLMRSPYLEQMFGPTVCNLFKQVKDLFDPHGIFNPHKKVGGNLEYSFAHLKQ
jgi:FAD/FMN-containing dehydrogenase